MAGGAFDTADARRELEQARAGCSRFLNGHGLRAAQELLSTIPPDTEPDRYGEGGVVAELEAEVAEVLGKEKACFFPSGTMAQQVVLRVHADRRGRRGVVFHPACHLDTHEGRGYERLHGLWGIPVGDARQLLSLSSLEQVHERPAALVLELPQRDLGGVLPEWEELEAEVAWARGRGAAVHLDGARLLEATPYYGRSAGEIATLFDTVYLSFYKGIGAITGCCVAGEADLVAEASEWRIRHGGRLFALWPYAASALTSLRARLPLMVRYYEHALSIAEALGELEPLGVRVLPRRPQAPMMHVELPATTEELRARALSLAASEGIWSFPGPFATDSPDRLRVELSVGDATLGFSPDEVASVFAALAGGRG